MMRKTQLRLLIMLDPITLKIKAQRRCV